MSDTLPNLVINIIVERVQSSKILGVIASNDLSWNKHIDGIITKASKRLYVLYQLKRAGVSQRDLLRVYLSVIRPVVEYACPVWHTNLPGYLSDSIEVVQQGALRTIYPGVSYSEAMEKSSMQTLFDRREELCKKYFTGLKRQDHKLHHLLPPSRSVPYPLRDAAPLVLPKVKTQRYFKSLVPWGIRDDTNA